MNERECKIIQDLIPNYVEEITNEETNNFIEGHLHNCTKCNKILSNMKRDFYRKENIEKKDISFMRKYNNILRVFKIILLTIVLVFISEVGRKLIILQDLKVKYDNTKNLDNYHLVCYGYYLGQSNENSTRAMTTTETFYKNGNHLTKYSVNQNGTDYTIYTLYNKDGDQASFEEKVANGETISKKDIHFQGDMQNAALKPASYVFENIHSLLYIALFYNINRVEIDNSQYYIISDKIANCIIDVKTGLTKKFISLNDFTVSDYFYEFDEVTDEDINI